MNPGGFVSYGLRLGPTRWRIAAAPALGDWIRQFVRILDLEAWTKPEDASHGREDRTLVLLPLSGNRHPGHPPILPEGDLGGFPSEEWRPISFHFLRWWRHDSAPLDILEVPVEEGEDQTIQQISLSCFPLYVRLAADGGFPLHAALVERRGQAVALAGPGGIGKSTCSRRVAPPWEAKADDLVLVVPKGNDAGLAEAHAFPTWSEYYWKRSAPSWKAGEAWPLQAVFFLSRSPTDKVTRLGQGEAALNMSGSAHQVLFNMVRCLPPPDQRGLRLRLFDNAARFVRNVPVYLLEFSLTGEFWRAMDEVLQDGPSSPRPG